MHFFTKKCKINKKTQKNLRIAGFFCSATRTREFRGIRKFHRNNRQSVAAENPRLRVRICSKKEPARFLFSSATRTRTGVYGVRGRCPRPLDDSTLSIFLKAGAKVLLFFDMTKFFTKKMHFDMHFFEYRS